MFFYFGKFFDIISVPFSCLVIFSPVMSSTCYPLGIVPSSCIFCSFLFPVSFFCTSMWKVFIDISSRLAIIYLAVVNLLMNSSKVFFMFVTVFLICRIFLLGFIFFFLFPLMFLVYEAWFFFSFFFFWSVVFQFSSATPSLVSYLFLMLVLFIHRHAIWW